MYSLVFLVPYQLDVVIYIPSRDIMCTLVLYLSPVLNPMSYDGMCTLAESGYRRIELVQLYIIRGEAWDTLDYL